MARPKSSEHALRRDEILDRAALCFARSGYPGTGMAEIAAASGTSKARLYHYYPAKQAILFDLLDRYTLRLLAVVAQYQHPAPGCDPDGRSALHGLIRGLLGEYQSSASRHVVLLHDTRFLGDAQRGLILQRQRDMVSAVKHLLHRAYPNRLRPDNQAAVTMLLFGMINWTFTWLRPDGAMSYAGFAEEVIQTLDRGFA